MTIFSEFHPLPFRVLECQRTILGGTQKIERLDHTLVNLILNAPKEFPCYHPKIIHGRKSSLFRFNRFSLARKSDFGLQNTICCDKGSFVTQHFDNKYKVRITKTVSMNTRFKILFLVLLIVLISNMVISDRLFIEFNPNDSDINFFYSPSIDPTSADSIKINLKPIIFLLCFGLVGIVVFARQRIGDKKDDKDIKT